MAKLNRKLDPHILEESKQRTMHVVMSQINEETIPWYQKIFSFKPMIALASSVVLLLVLSLSIGSINPPTPTVYALNEETSNTVAEMSYMASHLVAMQISIGVEDTSMLQFLNSESSTEFETSLEEFTTYFDMLKIYLNDTNFDELITYTEIDSEAFDVRINFNLEEFTYVLFLHQVDETTFDGVMVIDGVAFDVTGMIEKEDNETTFEFNAVNGEDFVTIEYTSETERDEVEKSYTIESTINGVFSQKEINIALEEDEQTVEIIDQNNSYELNKEFEDGTWMYKLEYELNNRSGEVTILEVTDELGQTGYAFQINEEGIEKEVTVGRPDFVDKDPSSTLPNDKDFPGGNPHDDDDDDEDDDEDDDHPGRGNGLDKDKDEDDDLDDPEDEDEDLDEPEDEDEDLDEDDNPETQSSTSEMTFDLYTA